MKNYFLGVIGVLALLAGVWALGALMVNFTLVTILSIVVISFLAPFIWKRVEFTGSPISQMADEIKKHKPFNQQEDRDKLVMLKQLRKNDNILSDKNTTMHFTASAWVVSEDRTKVLMIRNPDRGTWNMVSGHVDGHPEFGDVAMGKIMQLTGLKHMDILSDKIFSLEMLAVPGYVQNRVYIPSHLHLNVTYIFQGDVYEGSTKSLEDGGENISWIEVKAIRDTCNESWMLPIYYKLIERSKEIPNLVKNPVSEVKAEKDASQVQQQADVEQEQEQMLDKIRRIEAETGAQVIRDVMRGNNIGSNVQYNVEPDIEPGIELGVERNMEDNSGSNKGIFKE